MSRSKILFPRDKITKGDVIDYYTKIAPFTIPYIKDRPLVMQRFPNGIQEEGFYHKAIPNYFPKWIKRKKVKLETDGSQTLVVANKKKDLAYLANQDVLTPHIWLSTTKKLHFPNKIVLDLDPGKKGLKDLRFAAKKLKSALEKHGLKVFLMTTGSRGYHLVCPIKQTHNFNKVRKFVRTIVNKLAEKYPNKLTIETLKKKRKGRIFLDYLRNAYGQTSVAPYAIRPKPGAPIATPIEWKELRTTKPQKYTIKNIFKRLKCKKNPWKNMYKYAITLKL
jgi:bifunctional non-homologous end joining protein LigD